ncbi:MAG: glycine dehydrogenase (decarboxylating) subunit 2 [Firmicutes bacterium]|nr:glycine dehydrogenase (decarboxylating) subunit 2 [Bacillota bacterium]
MTSSNNDQPLIFERSRSGRVGASLPVADVPARSLDQIIPQELLRTAAADLPEVSEGETVRHYTALSQRNYSVDTGFYPLGSCTMKYNPKVNEKIAQLPGFAKIHPLQPDESVQGALAIMHEMQTYLAEIAGMDACTLQPVAGAHGELTGIKLIRAFHESRGEKRTQVIIPDSAHGTNPATVSMNGMEVVEIPSAADGGVDLEALRKAAGPKTAAFMLTNPNTLGLFDPQIQEIAAIVHAAGGLLYYDGANANAILGITRPGDMGFDVVHFNLHKTFSTPHGGGGPGSGPVGVKKPLIPFLPVPIVQCKDDVYSLSYDHPLSIGKVHSFYGNFAIYLRAYAYIRTMGPDGLKQVSKDAVLAANYVLKELAADYKVPFNRYCMHECVFDGLREAAPGIRTLDVAKRILDYGCHPPTIYFPLIIHEALMVEPTETESKETIDRFIAMMRKIAKEAVEQPELLTSAPHNTVVKRLDEVLAARKPDLRWKKNV